MQRSIIIASLILVVIFIGSGQVYGRKTNLIYQAPPPRSKIVSKTNDAKASFIAQRKDTNSKLNKKSQVVDDAYNKTLRDIYTKALDAGLSCLQGDDAKTKIRRLEEDLLIGSPSVFDRSILKSKINALRSQSMNNQYVCNALRGNVDKQSLALLVARRWDRSTVEKIGTIYQNSYLTLLDSFEEALLPSKWSDVPISDTYLQMQFPDRPVITRTPDYIKFEFRQPYIMYMAYFKKPIDGATTFTKEEKYKRLFLQYENLIGDTTFINDSSLRAVSRKPFEDIPGIEYGGKLPEDNYQMVRVYFVKDRILIIIGHSFVGEHPSLAKFLNSLHKNSFPEIAKPKAPK